MEGQALARSLPGSTNGILPEARSTSRVVIFERLSKQIPLNDFGLPTFLYRSDLIPENIVKSDEEERKSILNSASIDINYREGFPTFENGNPIWHRMPHESDEDFALFESYQGQSKTNGYRQLAIMDYPERLVQELYVYNYWSVRVKAHDMFIIAAHRKMREHRIMSAEDFQYVESTRLLETLQLRMKSLFSEERLSELEPHQAVKMLKDLFAIQRSSLGILPSTSQRGAKAADSEPSPHASMEVVLRSIAKQQGAGEGSNENKEQNLKALLSDPQAVGMAQELIIRMTSGGRPIEIEEVSHVDIDDIDKEILG